MTTYHSWSHATNQATATGRKCAKCGLRQRLKSVKSPRGTRWATQVHAGLGWEDLVEDLAGHLPLCAKASKSKKSAKSAKKSKKSKKVSKKSKTSAKKSKKESVGRVFVANPTALFSAHLQDNPLAAAPAAAQDSLPPVA